MTLNNILPLPPHHLNPEKYKRKSYILGRRVFLCVGLVAAALGYSLQASSVRLQATAVLDALEAVDQVSSWNLTANAKSRDQNDDTTCIFSGSPRYRKVFVFQSPGDIDWQGDILSSQGRGFSMPWPWQLVDNRTRMSEESHYHPFSMHAQFSTELLVREILTHPDSCLRTYDPEQASLFYVPYLPSMEFHAGARGRPPSFKTSKYANAILRALEGDYQPWTDHFGLTPKYWQRRNGSDHILVFSEPLQGLTHPKKKRGNYHFVHTQKQLAPPIVVSVELSTTFVNMYPSCAQKNILMPYPITDGRYFNGDLDKEARWAIQNRSLDSIDSKSSPVLVAEKDPVGTLADARPIAQWYRAGVHGECVPLRAALQQNYKCTPSFPSFKRTPTTYPLGMRMATFCPCPGGDTASAKRMFDAVLAGCIPIILSHDFVWPLSDEFEPEMLIKVSDFALRWNASNFVVRKFDNQCRPSVANTNYALPSVQELLEAIPASEIRRLRRGLRHAQQAYSYYKPRKGFPRNPLRDRVLPDGGASQALVAALAKRAGGVRWHACQKELGQLVEAEGKDAEPDRFKC
jgi:hypothetical protein